MSPEVRAAVLSAMGADGDERPPASPVRIVTAGGRLESPGELVLEDGTDLGFVARLPRDLPYGYHRLQVGDEELLLIAAPERCPLPDERAWGWSAQLYATRSPASWGIGDLQDLRELASWSRRQGARFCMISPLHAVTPAGPQQPSPYFPSSRRFRNPLYLRPELVPGAGERVRELATRARPLNDDRLIDRDLVWRLKAEALASVWEQAPRDGALVAYRAEQGEALEQWSTFCVAAERFGPDWRVWPAELRTPHGAQSFGAAQRDRVAFYAWLQWLLDRQLADAAAELPIVGDMAIGFDPSGADTWSWRTLFAPGMTIGAPPNSFNAAGQDWSLPPFVPPRLRAARYAPFIDTVRACLRHAGGLRIDHVMGLFRLWWVPAGATPADGAYVAYPADELLAIVALEAYRAGAWIIGEDLGTVDREVRARLAERDILSYRLLLFSGTDASAYPEHALAAVTTHDLPTVAGVWSGADLDQQRRAGLVPDVAGLAELRARLAPLVAPGAEVGDVVLAAHRTLAATPSVLAAATLEDAVLVEQRPNLPGTTAEQSPNWSMALPRTLDEIRADPFIARLAEALTADRRAGRTG